MLHHVPVFESHILYLTMAQLLMCITKLPLQLQEEQVFQRHVSKMCRILTIPHLDVMFGSDEHPQPVHLLPLQLVQLSPKIVVHKVQLFGKFAMLQAKKINKPQFNTKCSMSTKSLQNNGMLSDCAETYLDVFHVGIFQLFFKMGVFLKVLNDFPEVAVVVQPSVLKHKPKHTSVFAV